MKRTVLALVCLASAGLAQQKSSRCDEDWSERGHYCEMREVSVPASAELDVDGGTNGGISILGSNRTDILVRSRVQAYRDDESDSRQLAALIHVETASGHIRAAGPSETGKHGWGVSYEVFVPEHTSLNLHTHNGGINISGVQGRIQFEAVNGGVNLDRLAGSVEGHTTNGGVHLSLTSDHWDGDQCNVSTTNGGVTILVPENYSAHLETSTVNGGMRLGFPMTVQGEIQRHLSVDLGSGGKLVRVTTTNGGVNVEHTSGGA